MRKSSMESARSIVAVTSGALPSHRPFGRLRTSQAHCSTSGHASGSVPKVCLLVVLPSCPTRTPWLPHRRTRTQWHISPSLHGALAHVHPALDIKAPSTCRSPIHAPPSLHLRLHGGTHTRARPRSHPAHLHHLLLSVLSSSQDIPSSTTIATATTNNTEPCFTRRDTRELSSHLAHANTPRVLEWS